MRRRSAFDPARRERERLLTLERREAARAEGRAVAEGVAETVALSRARGTVFEQPRKGRGPSDQPYRRQSGLDWLAGKGRISAAQKAAGLAYGVLYRRARTATAIPSSLDVKPGMSDPSGVSLDTVMTLAESAHRASERLAGLRRRLCGQPDLIGACDLVCGEEMAPREAAGGDQRGAARIETLLGVALDLMVRDG